MEKSGGLVDLKETVLVAAAITGMVSGLAGLALAAANLIFVAKNFSVNHPSAKGIADRELQIYDKINTFDATISPLLSKAREVTTIAVSDLSDVRDRLKTIASDIYCPEPLRGALYALNAHLRSFEVATKTVDLPTRQTRVLWQACKDVGRRRIRQFISYDEPYLLFTVDESGDYHFVRAFRTRWQRSMFIASTRERETKFSYWDSAEVPPLLRRLLS